MSTTLLLSISLRLARGGNTGTGADEPLGHPRELSNWPAMARSRSPF
jgi:hypothetical protein